MHAISWAVAIFVANLFKSRQRLQAENLFLRHQLNVALRLAPLRRADIHDGPEQHASFEGPNTDAQDQLLQITHIRLATHGRSIQMCQKSK